MKAKRILAFALMVVLVIGCFASCRTKDENAYVFSYKGKNVEIRTSLYMCFLIDAEVSFQNDAVAEAQKSSKKYDDYKDLKLDDKDYDTWVKDKAKSEAQKYAFAEIQFDRLGYTLSDQEQQYIDAYAEQQWYGSDNSQGIQEVYETNGISLNTFKKYFANVYYKQDSVYSYYVADASVEEETTTAVTTTGKNGETETVATTKKVDSELKNLKGSLRPADDKIVTALDKNFVLADVIEFGLTDSNGNAVDDDTKDGYMKLLKDYKKQLEKGTDFATVYATYQQQSGTSTDSSSSQSSTSNYEKIIKSADANTATGNGDEADENFNDIYKMKVNDIKIFENDDCYKLVVRKNILKDKNSSGTAYKDSYTDYAIRVLVEDKYDKDVVEKAIDEMKVDANNSAIKYYKPDKIDYLQDTTTATTAANK